MKKLTLILSAVMLAAVLLTSCGGKSDPKTVAQQWINAFYTEDYPTAKKLSTADVTKHLDEMANSGQKIPQEIKDKAKTIKVKDCKEEGDKATVTCISSEIASPDMSVMLEKHDGKWLVSDIK